MLKEKNMSNTCWVEALKTAIYILNMGSMKSVPNQTPIEAWSSIKPVISYMNIFNCLCYAHVPIKNRSKFDNKYKIYIFVDYADGAKEYIMYNLKKMINDILFDDENAY